MPTNSNSSHFEERIWKRLEPDVIRLASRRRKILLFRKASVTVAAIATACFAFVALRPHSPELSRTTNSALPVASKESHLAAYLERSQIALTEWKHSNGALGPGDRQLALQLLNENQQLLRAETKPEHALARSVLQDLGGLLQTIAAGNQHYGLRHAGLESQPSPDTGQVLFEVRLAETSLRTEKSLP